MTDWGLRTSVRDTWRKRDDVVVNHIDRFCGGNFVREQMGNTQGRSHEGKKSVRFLDYVEKSPNTYFKLKCDTEL